MHRERQRQDVCMHVHACLDVMLVKGKGSIMFFTDAQFGLPDGPPIQRMV